MSRVPVFFAGAISGVLLTALILALAIRFLPDLLVVRNQPTPADAIVILGGDSDGSRLRMGLKLHDDQLAPRLLLVAGSSKHWEQVLRKLGPDVTLEGRGAILLDGSLDTRTDAELALQYCRENGLSRILVVTSPYHTRRSQFIFNDIAEEPVTGDSLLVTSTNNPATSDQSRVTSHQSLDFKIIVLSSNDYGNLLPPDAPWWADRKTLETVWLEFGKILYWELTPFMEFQGEGEKLKESDRTR